MLNIGFTGTRKGKTEAQLASVISFLDGLEFIAHHGDCEGWDEIFDIICYEMQICRLLYPSTSKTRRWSEVHRPENCEVAQLAKPPMERNPDIVNPVDAMLACPGEMFEELRSGTWATIRYARKINKPLIIIWPDGSITEEGFND